MTTFEGHREKIADLIRKEMFGDPDVNPFQIACAMVERGYVLAQVPNESDVELDEDGVVSVYCGDGWKASSGMRKDEDYVTVSNGAMSISFPHHIIPMLVGGLLALSHEIDAQYEITI